MAFSQDNIWLFGYSSTSDPNSGWGGTVMDFNHYPPSISYLYNTMNFRQTNASICNESGELLFYTNGLYVANSDHQPMQDGLGLNPGEFASSQGGYGYFLDQGAIIVPHPDGSNRFFLFHANANYPVLNLEAHTSQIYYTLVDMDAENGLGRVVEKNQPVVSDTLVLGKLSAVRHGNGRDWWLLASEFQTNNFYRILVSPEGVQNLGTFSEGLPVPLAGIGQAVFSPNGEMYLRNNIVGTSSDADYLDLFWFDRCEGRLSGHVQMPYVHVALAGGAVVSPNSRYLYVTHSTEIYQFDLMSDDIEASKKTIAEYDGFTDNGISVRFHLGQLAPDGKIYVSSPNSVHYLLVIHQPNLPYPDCVLEQHGVHLPTYNSASMPNFPNYRLGPLDGSPCDTLGLDNHPIAKFRYDQDTADYLSVRFTDLSYYEPDEWAWSFGDGTVSQDTSPVHTFPGDGTYEVCLTVSNQYSSNTFCRTLVIGVSATEDEAAEQKPVVSVFPNPAKEATNFILSGYLPRHAELRLFTATGQLALTQRIGFGWSLVGLEGIAPGLYFYEVKDSGRLLGSGKLVRVE